MKKMTTKFKLQALLPNGVLSIEVPSEADAVKAFNTLHAQYASQFELPAPAEFKTMSEIHEHINSPESKFEGFKYEVIGVDSSENALDTMMKHVIGSILGGRGGDDDGPDGIHVVNLSELLRGRGRRGF